MSVRVGMCVRIGGYVRGDRWMGGGEGMKRRMNECETKWVVSSEEKNVYQNGEDECRGNLDTSC